MSKANLEAAKRVKNDEFYTLMDTIIEEVHHYKDHFKDKVVLLNCDDPEWSNFWKVSKMIFKDYGIKKVVSTHYNPEGPSYKLELVRGPGGHPVESNPIPLKGHGDFADEECRALMKEADIVMTNPPFSLFKEYVAQLIAMKKKFLIIGNFNAVTYKEIYPYLQDKKMWLGVSPRSMLFKQKDTEELKPVNACWYTNLTHKKRNKKVTCYKTYTPEEYPKYDNYDAIEVGYVHLIPEDYAGVMGVPITFLTQHNPKQFALIGNAGNYAPDGYSKVSEVYLKGNKKYKRLLIQRI